MRITIDPRNPSTRLWGDTAGRGSYVLTLDECDAFARSGCDNSEHKKLCLVVNNLLLFIDRFKAGGSILEATKLERARDEGVGRHASLQATVN